MSTAVLAIRLLLAAVFVVAAIGKLRDLEGSRRAMRDFGVPPSAAKTFGVLLPLAELAVAVALVPTDTARWGAIGAFLLLLAFTAGIANALRKGEEPDCHCFGQIHSSPAGRGTLARNAVLAALAAVVVVDAPGAAVDTWVGDRSAAELVAIALGVCAAVLAVRCFELVQHNRRLLFDLNRAQRQALSAPPGIPIGTNAPRFTLANLQGETISLDALRERGLPVLLTFVSPSCGSCVELLPKLQRWQISLSEQLTVAIVTTGTAKQNQPMFAEYELENVLLQNAFEVADAYRMRGTPSTVIVAPDGTVASNPAETVFGIEPLLRQALNSDLARVERPVA